MSSKDTGLSAAEKAAVKERAAELKAEAKRGTNREKGEKEVFSKIAEMKPEDRAMAERIHELVKEHAPDLMPKTMYGMPAYANDDGKVVCFFQAASKWDTRYATFSFEDLAKLDDGDMWPTTYAIAKLTPAVEKKLVELIRKAVG